MDNLIHNLCYCCATFRYNCPCFFCLINLKFPLFTQIFRVIRYLREIKREKRRKNEKEREGERERDKTKE